MPAFQYASCNKASCPSRLGVTRRPLLLPSWFTALPRITAWMGSLSTWAWDKGLSKMTPTPSLRTYPLALASPNLQRPSGANSVDLEYAIVIWGCKIRFTPPARANSLSPLRKLWQAKCTATSDDEQWVSIVKLGPRKSKT